MSAIRIVVFIHSLDGGGAERCVSRLLEQWARTRPEIELHLVLNKARFDYTVPPSVRVHIIGCEHVTLLGKVIDQFRRLKRAIELLNAVRPDAVLALMPWSNLLALLARVFSRTKPRLVLSERTSYALQTGHGLKGLVVRAMVRFVYPAADRLVAVSEDLADELRRTGGLQQNFVVAIPNAVDSEALRAAARAVADPHPWLATSRETPTVVFAGRLEAVKGLDVLLDAWERVLRRIPARLLILGKGSQLERLQAQAAALPDGGASVQLLPFQANPFAFIERADVFVLPSRREGFPNVLLEALALGRPCVAANCPTGPRELLGDDEFGLLVPPANAEALADALVRMLSEPALRAHFGEQARIRAARFSPAAVAERYLSVLLGERAARPPCEARPLAGPRRRG